MSLHEGKLGELLSLFNGKAPELSDDGSYVAYGSNGAIRLSKKPNHPASIVLGRVGAYCGSVVFSSLPLWASDNKIVVRPIEGHSLKYWYYKLLTVPLRGYAGGAAQPLITHSIIRPISVKFHDDLPTQTRIASILSAYDDLIENNRRRIGLLEQAARLLYREWFVHFRFPGHETATFVDGLPEGWAYATIADLFGTSSGSTPSRKNDAFFGGQINWLKTQELQNCFIFETDEKITEEGLKRSSAKMFPENTVIVAMYGATIGQLAILAKPSSTNQACCALLPKRHPGDFMFGYCLMEHSARALKDRGQGAAQNNVSQQVIRAMEIIQPSNVVLDAFNSAISSNFTQRRNLQAQNAKLTRARDLLLPRLMDGRIPV